MAKLNMKNKPLEEQINSFIIVPRSVLADYRKGIITTTKRNLLCWLRLTGDPYGIASVDLDLLAKETFNTYVDKSYINRLKGLGVKTDYLRSTSPRVRDYDTDTETKKDTDTS